MKKQFKTLALQGVTMAALLSLPFIPATAGANDFSGKLTGVSIIDAGADNKAPVASFTYTIEDTTVTFDASSSSDPDGTISQYQWDFGDGNTGSGARIQHVYSEKTAVPVTLTVIDNQRGVAITQAQVLFQKPFSLAVNFQPLDADIPAGYVADGGLAFDAAKGYGWTIPTGSMGARDRNSAASPDQAYDTMIHVAPTAKWEAEVPAGNYLVTVCAGDASWPTSTPEIQVEGVTVMTGEALSRTNPWIEKSIPVTVNDGRVTMTFTGSLNPPTRLCWIKIQQQ
ncbi:MAG: PKD domain-containing protein [Desulfobulbus sp.]|jgi:PKD repeat protein